jgi:hypothetical protein
MGSAVDLHEGEEFVIQHRHVPFIVHYRLGRQEEDQASAALAAKAGPHRNVHGCLMFTNVNFCLYQLEKNGLRTFWALGLMMAKDDSSENITVSQSFAVQDQTVFLRA